MSKKLALAKVSERIGLTRLLEYFPSVPGIFVLNYHRIGNAHSEPYDRLTFTTSIECFDEQIKILKKRYRCLSLPELQEFVDHPATLKRFYVMITFDDGYLDNFTKAFPVLKAHGVPATFFLCTSLIGSSHVAWWDRAAYCVRNCTSHNLQLSYPSAITLDLSGPRELAIRQLLRVYKAQRAISTGRFLAELSSASGVAVPEAQDRRFLNWEEARQMLRGGMSIGSHTVSHNILSQLTYDQQLAELADSKRELEAKLDTAVTVLAFPVGSRTSFNQDTINALKATGYRTAFSQYSATNNPKTMNAYNISRSIPCPSVPVFRMHTAIAAKTNYDWI